MGRQAIFQDLDTSVFHTSSRRLRRLFFSSPVLSSASRLGRAGGSCSLDRALAMQGDELVLGPLSRQQESRLPRQNFPLNLPTNRRLCSTVGGRIVEGWAAHCCAVSAARSRAATMTNLARSSLALVLPTLFGAAKSCALVNLFKVCTRWSASGQPPTTRFCF